MNVLSLLVLDGIWNENGNSALTSYSKPLSGIKELCSIIRVCYSHYFILILYCNEKQRIFICGSSLFYGKF